jgi:hypothetical protein
MELFSIFVRHKRVNIDFNTHWFSRSDAIVDDFLLELAVQATVTRFCRPDTTITALSEGQWSSRNGFEFSPRLNVPD